MFSGYRWEKHSISLCLFVLLRVVTARLLSMVKLIVFYMCRELYWSNNQLVKMPNGFRQFSNVNLSDSAFSGKVKFIQSKLVIFGTKYVLKNGPSKTFLKAIFHKLYLAHFWTLCTSYFTNIVNLRILATVITAVLFLWRLNFAVNWHMTKAKLKLMNGY